jgi:hypothetical protein
VNPPPWIHTITGRPALDVASGVQTLSERQSSLVPAMGLFPRFSSCGQYGPFCVASRAAVHAAGGCGGFHRSGPVGAAA